MHKTSSNTLGTIIVFRLDRAKNSWSTIAQVSASSSRTMLGNYVATDGQFVSSGSISTLTSDGIVLILESEPGLIDSGRAVITSVTAGVASDITVYLLDEDGANIIDEYSVSASFEADSNSLIETTFSSSGYEFSSLIPLDETPSTLWLRVSGLTQGHYVHDLLPVEVRIFRLPVTSIFVSPMMVVLGQTVTYHINFSGGDISAFPIFVSLNNEPFPIRPEVTGAGLQIELPTSSSYGASTLNFYRCETASGNILRSIVVVSRGTLTSVYVFPEAMLKGNTIRVFFGYLNEFGVNFDIEFPTTVSGAGITIGDAEFDSTNCWYYFDLPKNFISMELTLSATDGGSVVDFEIILKNLKFSNFSPIEVGESYNFYVYLLNDMGLPILDGRPLRASFGSRGSFYGNFIYSSQQYRLPFSTETFYNAEVVAPVSSVYGYIQLYTVGFEPLCTFSDALKSCLIPATYGVHWIDSHYVIIEQAGKLLTAGPSGEDATFKTPGGFLYGQVFYVAGDPANEFYLYSLDLPMVLDSVLYTGTPFDAPTHFIATQVPSESGVILFDPLSFWANQPRYIKRLKIFTNYISALGKNSVSVPSVVGPGEDFNFVLLHTHDHAFVYGLDSKLFLSYNINMTSYSSAPDYDATLVIDSLPSMHTFPASNLWDYYDMTTYEAIRRTNAISSLLLTTEPTVVSSLAFLTYRFEGGTDFLTSAMFGGSLVVPSTEGELASFTTVNHATGNVLGTGYPEFQIDHRFGAATIKSGGFSLALVGGEFRWTSTNNDSIWFRPVEISALYEIYFFLYGEDDYLCADSAGTITVSSIRTFDCIFEIGMDYYRTLYGMGYNILVLNDKNEHVMQTLLEEIVPYANIIVQNSLSITGGPWDLVISEPVIAGFFSDGGFTLAAERSDSDIIAAVDAIASYIQGGGSVVFTYDSCVWKNICGPNMRSAMGIIDSTSSSSATFNTIQFEGDANSPMNKFLPGITGEELQLSSFQNEFFADVDEAEVTVLYRGVSATKPFCWTNHHGSGRFAFVSIAPLNGNQPLGTLNENEQQILKALIFWGLRSFE
eukprot:gnl/Chilomastix_cuspidata/3268.p1 GENE.gnl/Chilomastix_cuspidata/3268~~gnl/Chilomastix_cuspidata/3268.p1  ORF type:complete len:1089 (-),score=7.94 gnl/Chilomastix_cuspidata/3268:58-3231(-)